MRIAQNLKNDKRSKSTIETKVQKTKILLTYNNFKINLTKVDALRIAKVLNKALAIQETRKLHDQNKEGLTTWMIKFGSLWVTLAEVS